MTKKSDESFHADVIVIGGGAAGLTAALTAAEKGATTTIIEKRDVLGGNANMIEAITGAETHIQIRSGFGHITRDYVFQKCMEYCRWDCNSRIVRVLIDESAETIKWLEEKGVKFKPYVRPIWPGQDPVNWHEIIGPRTAWRKGSGELIKVLEKKCKDLGVQIFYQTAAKQLLTQANGPVTGVMATREGGKQLEFRGKAIIICTGGYAGDQHLIALHPYYHSNFVNYGLPHTGDGIKMTTQIGAATEGLGHMCLTGPCPSLPREIASINIKTGDVVQQVALVAVAQEPYTIWVNKKGRRFCDEAFSFNHYELSNPILRQPDVVSYTIFDTGILKRMEEKGFYVGLSLHGEGWELQRAGNIVGLESELKRLSEETSAVKVSNSLEDLAKWIGIDPDTLESTIKEYNQFCQEGYDALFLKSKRWLLPLRTPPYYTIRCSVLILHTCGGIKINEHLEVVNKEGNPIPGLYAAGDETGGWENVAPSFIMSSVGIGAPAGRIAGRNAAKYAKDRKDG